ncbi:hypothetical protein Tco_0094534 [Tanacetum coccineum]
MTSSTDLPIKEKEAFIDPNNSYLFFDRALANIKLNNLSGDRYGYIKNHKKIVKNGQTQTRETEEYKRAKDSKSKPGKVKKSNPGQQKSTH